MLCLGSIAGLPAATAWFLPLTQEQFSRRRGLDSNNTNRHDIASALIEGTVIGLAQGMNRLTALGIEVKELCVTGRGAKSASMRKIVADILPFP